MQTFAATAPITTVLDIPAGQIQLIAADRADATVEVQPADASKGRDVKAAEQTSVDFRDGILRIQTAVKNQLMGPSGAVQVTVHLPAGSAVQGKVASADVHSTGPLGEVSFEAAHGQLTFDETGDAQLTVQAGDVQVGRLNGSATITTSKGDIRIAEATGGALVLTTQAGEISVGAATGVSASLDASTSSGRVHNTLKNDGTSQLTIQATTSVGDIVARSL
ncbi:DUF4097 family beta strand repeat protein [Actinomadura barringtoniae]|uniref:DUF4097 family beta strand repeat protein n=1 Tax=Actinomadura barringtoniae TaxID=1427535 RepID=A0A939PM79_9ACTN|nr:DUF4097 family beta strand repeat-containing protein [Actinomadura barringtoniae]MBO2451126.1 DUF4097 family beta strand repeat protein [Actinomadura barringtoniae]